MGRYNLVVRSLYDDFVLTKYYRAAKLLVKASYKVLSGSQTTCETAKILGIENITHVKWGLAGEASIQTNARTDTVMHSAPGRKSIARPTRFSLRRTLFVIVTVCASSDFLQMLIYHQHFVGFPQSGFCYESSPVLIATNSSSRCTMVWDKSLGCACSV